MSEDQGGSGGWRRDGPQVSFERRLHRRYALFTVGLLGFVGLMAGLERLGWSRAGIGSAFLIGTVLVYALIGLFSRTSDLEEYMVAGRRVPAFHNGMATAADWMSAASFIATASVIWLQGYEGLAWILGWTGGFCLVALLLAPYLRRTRSYTLPDYFALRFGGWWPRTIALIVTLLVSFVYVVVQVYSVGLITSHLTGFNFELGIMVGLGGVLVCSFLGGMRAVTWTQVAQCIVLVVAFTVPVIGLSLKQTGSWWPWLSAAGTLAKVDAREHELRADPAEATARALLARRAEDTSRKLADVPGSRVADAQRMRAEVERLHALDAPLALVQRAERELARAPRSTVEARHRYERDLARDRQQMQPLAGLAPSARPLREGEGGAPHARWTFVAQMLCLMLGTAALPHLLVRSHTVTDAREARRSTAWALVWIVAVYVSVPLLALMIKHEVFSQLIGLPFSDLPDWLRRWARLNPELVGFEDINLDGVLQLAELRLGGDVIVLAAPEMGGMPLVLTYLVAAGGLAAALSTADALLLTIANGLTHDLMRPLEPGASTLRRVMLSKLLVLLTAVAAAWVASMRLTDILPLVTASFSVAAATFFPPLVAGIFWRRAERIGVVLGMLGGAATTIGYMVHNAPAARAFFGLPPLLRDERWFGIDPMAAGVFGVPVAAALILLVGSLRRAPAPADPRQRLVTTMRGDA